MSARLAACLAAASLVVLPGALGAAEPDAGHELLTPEAMWKLARLAAPALAPDGRHAALAVSRVDLDANKALTDLYLLPTGPGLGAGRALTSGGTVLGEQAFSPDGRFLVFVARRADDKQPQLYLLPTDGGEARRLTDLPTGAAAPKWFRDSRRLAFISRVWPELKSREDVVRRLKERDESKVSARVFEHAPFSHWDHFLDDREPHVFVTDIDGREPFSPTLGSGRHLDVREPGLDAYDVAPDGGEIAFAADADPGHNAQNFDIFTVPVGGGAARDLTPDNPADDDTPRYSPDGRWLAYSRRTIPRFYADTRHVVLLDRHGGASRPLAPAFDRSAEGLVWLPDSSGLLASIEDGATRRVFEIGVRGARPRAITTTSDFAGIAVAGQPAVVVALRQSFSEPPTLVRIDPASGAVVKLSAFNDAALRRLRLGAVENVRVPAAAGAEQTLWIVKPPDAVPGRRYPLLMLLHGGPHGEVSDVWQWRWNAQVFAAWGYVTTWHNFHGSTGYGQAYTDSISRDWATLPYADTMAAADWLRAQPYVDDARMVAAGGSYGGYLATLLLGRPQPFKALIAHAAVTDLYAELAEDYGAQQSRYGEFWQRKAEFEAQSPLDAAANFATPTLILHGQLDLRVPVNNSLELFNVLQNKGVPSKFVYFPDENHWVLKPQNSLFWYATVRDWLARYAPP
jgi:dipeptidyl aminopeptidase/acylaminoacyl peptidase